MNATQLVAEPELLVTPRETHAACHFGIWSRNGGRPGSDFANSASRCRGDRLDRPRLVARDLGDRAPALHDLAHATLDLDDLTGHAVGQVGGEPTHRGRDVRRVERRLRRFVGICRRP